MKVGPLKIVLQWIFSLPLAVLIYMGTNLSFSFSFSFLLPEVIDGLSEPDLGGFYILGSIFTFIRESLAFGLAVFTFIYMVPKGKTLIYSISMIVWGVFVLFVSLLVGMMSSLAVFGYIWETGFILSTVMITLAQLNGFICTGVIVFNTKHHKNEQSNCKNP